jgi:hypothetical protein
LWKKLIIYIRNLARRKNKNEKILINDLIFRIEQKIKENKDEKIIIKLEYLKKYLINNYLI